MKKTIIIDGVEFDKKLLRELMKICGPELCGLRSPKKKRVFLVSKNRYVDIPETNNVVRNFANELVESGYRMSMNGGRSRMSSEPEPTAGYEYPSDEDVVRVQDIGDEVAKTVEELEEARKALEKRAQEIEKIRKELEEKEEALADLEVDKELAEDDAREEKEALKEEIKKSKEELKRKENELWNERQSKESYASEAKTKEEELEEFRGLLGENLSDEDMFKWERGDPNVRWINTMNGYVVKNDDLEKSHNLDDVTSVLAAWYEHSPDTARIRTDPRYDTFTKWYDALRSAYDIGNTTPLQRFMLDLPDSMKEKRKIRENVINLGGETKYRDYLKPIFNALKPIDNIKAANDTHNTSVPNVPRINSRVFYRMGNMVKDKKKAELIEIRNKFRPSGNK